MAITGQITDPLESFDHFKSALGDWQKPLKNHLQDAGFRGLFNYVKKEYAAGPCYPPKELIFNAF